MHTLTYLGIHTPAALFARDDRDAAKALAVERRWPRSTSTWPSRSRPASPRDAAGRPCIEAIVPQDVEADLAMPGGHIFHGDLDWPWAANRARLDTPRSSGACRPAWPR